MEPRRRNRAVLVGCGALFLVAISVRVALAIVRGAFPNAPAGEMFSVARSIATTGVFADPFGVPSGPTVHVPPIHPYFLAALLRLTSDDAFPYVVIILNIVAASLVWSLFPIVAPRLMLPSWRVGFAAGALGAISPLRHWIELNGYWDATLAGLSAMLMTAHTFSRRTSWTSARTATAVGIGWALVVLLQPATVNIFAVLLLLLLLSPASPGARIRGMGVVLMAFALTLTPWTIRNYRTMGGMVFVRGNLGTELSVSNNDGALAEHGNMFLNPHARHPHVDAVEFAKRLEIGELNYDRVRLREAVDWMRAHPMRTFRLTVQRFALFWLPPRSHVLLTALEWTFTGLALAGVWYLPRPTRLLVLGIWMVYPLLYYLVQADERYRYPIEWTIVLSSGMGLTVALDWLSRHWTPSSYTRSS